jgi:probable rRNA maturation factor
MDNTFKSLNISVHVHNRQRKIPINLQALQRFAEKALGACRQEIQPTKDDDLPNEIHVLLISDERMSILHQRFLNQTGPTDVITFQHGEIFISAPTARRQAREFGTSLLDEIQLYIVHGLLHLQGFDDRSPREQKLMRAAEARMLRRIAV